MEGIVGLHEWEPAVGALICGSKWNRESDPESLEERDFSHT